MLRIPLTSAVLLTALSLGTFAALAQSTAPKAKSPGEMAEAAAILAEKTAACQRQAKDQKLSFIKRRRFVRACVKDGK